MINKVIEYIDAHRESYVERLKDLLRIKSISTDPSMKQETRRAGEWVLKTMKDCGIKAELIETPGHPAVFASMDGGGKGPTVLVYGHYDVQPTGDESLWKSPPFEPTVRDGSLFARGSADDKGQAVCHLFAAEAWMKAAGKLPVRTKFLIEGEEEISSPNLETIIRTHRDRLACDFIVLSDTSKFNKGVPAITYGTKGLVYKEVTLYGPKQDLHSGSFGGTVTNPGNALASIIASMKDPVTNRVLIPGFYDDVLEMDADEKGKMLGLPFEELKFREDVGVNMTNGEHGYNTVERKWVRPTLDVNGILCGFTGQGGSTIIPSKAMAKVSMRLVPNMNPRKIYQAFDETVHLLAPQGVRIEIKTFGCAAPYMCPLSSPAMKAAAAAIESGYGVAPAFIREGGSLPILPMFKEVLGAESIMMGFCDPNCNAHGPNEFFDLDDLHKGIRSAAQFLERMAGG
ncbi:MAG: dipeptidase [Phycisphaerales bacterium]|nr:dipeptidase [Phycisphaerales bacterium]